MPKVQKHGTTVLHFNFSLFNHQHAEQRSHRDRANAAALRSGDWLRFPCSLKSQLNSIWAIHLISHIVYWEKLIVIYLKETFNFCPVNKPDFWWPQRFQCLYNRISCAEFKILRQKRFLVVLKLPRLDINVIHRWTVFSIICIVFPKNNSSSN